MAEENQVPEASQENQQNVDAPGPAEGPQVDTGQPEAAAIETNRDARMWAMFCHLAALAGFILVGIGVIIGPLVVWLMKKEEFPFVDEQGKEALNFQISMFIYGIVAGLLCFVCIGFVLAPLVGITDLVFLIIAAIKANNGEHYRYPLTIRLIK